MGRGPSGDIPMSGPDIGEEEAAVVADVVRSGRLSTGERLGLFEEALRTYVGCREAVGVTNGTAALHLCMVTLGIGPGDEVITTPFSFVASANCILFERGRPVFVDIEEDALGIDPDRLEAAITARTRAILVVHVFGRPAKMGPILEVARRHSLPVIEDACEALGAEVSGRRAGSLGDAGVFGFYPNKQLTMAEGGAIVTDNASWAAQFRSLRNQGRDSDDDWLAHARLGYNYRLDEIRSALGAVQLSRIDELLAKRRRVAEWYAGRLSGEQGIDVPNPEGVEGQQSWFVYVIQLRPEHSRDRVMAFLREQGIPSRVYFPAIHLQPFYRDRFGHGPGDFPVAERVSSTCLSLPFSSVMTEQQVDRVCDVLREAIRSRA